MFCTPDNGNLADFMSNKLREYLDSDSSSDSGRGTANGDQHEGDFLVLLHCSL